MESFLVSTHRGLVHWQGLLLVVSLLNFWCLPTTAKQDMWVKYAAEGDDVLLRISNKPPDVARLAWYRGMIPAKKHTIAFFANTKNFRVRVPKVGRMILNTNCSLLLKKVTIEDTGIYTVAVEQRNSKILIGYGLLNIYRRVRKPTLQASNTTVTEDKDTVVFTCNTDVHTIQWLFNGTKLQRTERIKLPKDRRRLTINPVKREDAGNYQCEAFNPVSSAASVALELHVKVEGPLCPSMQLYSK